MTSRKTILNSWLNERVHFHLTMDGNSSHSGGYIANILLMPNFDGTIHLLQVNRIFELKPL